MSHTFTQLLCHIVFSTQYRIHFIEPGVRDELHPYMMEVVRTEGGVVLAIGGMPDHVHLLVRMKPTLCLSDLVRSVKANSSRWVHEQAGLPREFAWQEGYGAFSVSESAAPTVTRYIRNQERHHRHRSFEDEWVLLLKKHGIDFDPAAPFG